MIQLIEIISYTTGEPERIGQVWWSPEQGLTTDADWLATELQRDGVQTGLDWRQRARPGEGQDREIFEALPRHYSSLVRAQAPVEVETQGGEAVS